MAEPPQDAGLLAQISGGLALVLGWFWAMLNGNKKNIDAVKAQVEDHEKRVLKEYPTRDEMFDALDKTVRPIHDKLDDTTVMLREIKNEIQRKDRDELERLRNLARDQEKR